MNQLIKIEEEGNNKVDKTDGLCQGKSAFAMLQKTKIRERESTLNTLSALLLAQTLPVFIIILVFYIIGTKISRKYSSSGCKIKDGLQASYGNLKIKSKSFQKTSYPNIGTYIIHWALPPKRYL